MKATQLGIIGCGVIAHYHARALQGLRNVELAAVADLRPEAARRLAKEFSVPRIYTHPDALLADDKLDGVILALPANVRTELALEAFRAGLDVLTEKPAAMNTGEIRQLIDGRGHCVAACCSSRYHFTGTARRAKEFIRSGRLGKLRHLRCRNLSPAGPPPTAPKPAWRTSRQLNGGGVLVNLGSYDLDFLLGILGWSLRPRSVLASTFSVPPQFETYLDPDSDAETHVTALLAFEGGVTMSYERAEYYPGQAESTYEITGSEGTLRLSMLPGPGPLLTFEDEVLWSGPETWDPIHFGPVLDFVDSVRNRTPPQTGLEEALVLTQITDAIYASAERGEAVELLRNVPGKELAASRARPMAVAVR